jgi:malate/lactate dehydrogenase
MSVAHGKDGDMKVGIIGAGAVGSVCLTAALVARGCARDVVVVNRDRKRAEGLVTDVQYGVVLGPYNSPKAKIYTTFSHQGASRRNAAYARI